MISAAITPGIHPKSVRMNTIMKLPHPLSTTASGGKIMDSITRITDMAKFYLRMASQSIAG